MNGKFSKRHVNDTMIFYSDVYSDKVTEAENKLKAEISALIAENHAVMFSWKYKDGTSYKLIFFPYADESGKTRIVTLINNVPFGHTNDLDSGIDDIITVIRKNDVFYKTA